MKREMYYDEVIRLHYELGYGENKIAEILPIGHSTAWRWIRKFAADNKGKTTVMARTKKTTKERTASEAGSIEAEEDIQALKAELSAMKARLKPTSNTQLAFVLVRRALRLAPCFTSHSNMASPSTVPPPLRAKRGNPKLFFPPFPQNPPFPLRGIWRTLSFARKS